MPELSRLALLQLTLKENLDTLKTLNAEIVDLIDDETELTQEIEQADTYRETLFHVCILSPNQNGRAFGGHTLLLPHSKVPRAEHTRSYYYHPV